MSEAYVRLGHPGWTAGTAEVHLSTTAKSVSSKRPIMWITPAICGSSRKSSKEGVMSLSPTREDIQRYRGILDALVSELEEDGAL
nr:MAG TPA: hypothetical protein [Caudoviricetes sp.]